MSTTPNDKQDGDPAVRSTGLLEEIAIRCERRAQMLRDCCKPGSLIHQEAGTWEDMAKEIRANISSNYYWLGMFSY